MATLRETYPHTDCPQFDSCRCSIESGKEGEGTTRATKFAREHW
ncbi:MAG: hypothetical protein ACYC5M_12650 [Anaerolineae bacterium]